MSPQHAPQTVSTNGRTPVGVLRHLQGLVLVTHPLPSAMYIVVTGFLCYVAAAAAHRSVGVLPLALVLLAVACAQIAVGSLNDYCDRALDAAAARNKPIVRGMIAAREALVLVALGSIVVVVAGALLGPLALLLCLLIEGLGLAYDLRYKGTVMSALLFAAYFPLFPLLAWVVFGRWQPFLPWLLPIGAVLGIAMNVANTLPDLEADRAAGIRGLPHLLGLRRGLLVAWGVPPLVAATIAILHATGVVPAHVPALLLALAAGIVPSLIAAAAYARRPVPATLRATFLVQGLGVIVLAGAWIAAVAF